MTKLSTLDSGHFSGRLAYFVRYPKGRGQAAERAPSFLTTCPAGRSELCAKAQDP